MREEAERAADTLAAAEAEAAAHPGRGVERSGAAEQGGSRVVALDSRAQLGS